MESIIQAVDMVKANEHVTRNGLPTAVLDGTRRVQADPRFLSVKLDEAHLERNRIVAHKSVPGTRSFDLLRTKLLQEMDKNSWQCLGITSPTAGCGKSTIACNLAVSIGRMVDRSAVLVDLNLTSPTVGNKLGLPCETSVADILEGRSDFSKGVVNAAIGTASLMVFPGKGSASYASDLLASASLANFLQTLKREFRNRLVILDLPSVLDGDEVMSVLPHIDAALLVASAGTSTIADVHDCRNHLERTPIVRVVVNNRVRSKDADTRF